MKERVQKILARAGIASRRKCEVLISEGMVLVNNNLIKLGDKADVEHDVITVNGKRVIIEKYVYLIVNKPKKYISTVSDEHDRKTVLDLVDVKEKVFPVGRLDRDARGLMVLTNDGDLANKIMHPRYDIEKTYVVTVRESFKDADAERLRKGVFIEGRKVVPSKVIVHTGNIVEIVVHEGRKHIVKRIFFRLGYFVTDLVRTKVACLSLKGLAEGEWRELSHDEVLGLRRYLKMA